MGLILGPSAGKLPRLIFGVLDMRQPLVAGNWKLNGSREGVKALLAGIRAGMGRVKKAEVAVCPGIRATLSGATDKQTQPRARRRSS